MSRNNDIYKMYEEEVLKNERANKIIRDLKLEIYTLKTDLKKAQNKIEKEIERTSNSYIEKMKELE